MRVITSLFPFSWVVSFPVSKWNCITYIFNYMCLTEIYIKTRTELCNRSAQPPPPPKWVHGHSLRGSLVGWGESALLAGLSSSQHMYLTLYSVWTCIFCKILSLTKSQHLHLTINWLKNNLFKCWRVSWLLDLLNDMLVFSIENHESNIMHTVFI